MTNDNHYNINEKGIITTLPTEQQIQAYKRIIAGYPRRNGGVAWSQLTVEEISRAIEALKGTRVLAVADAKSGSNLLVNCSCPKHGTAGFGKPVLLNDLFNHRKGNRCSCCKAECRSAERAAVTASFVGTVTPDGHTILEHVGYHQTPSDAKQGECGRAKYRYRCAVCGNQDAVGLGTDLKRPGNTTHCGCLSKKDSRLVFSRNEQKAQDPCFVYIFSVVKGSGVKIGIAKYVSRRATKSYGEQLFVSQSVPRATAWAVEQVLLHKIRRMGLQYELQGTGAFETGEAGASEVFYSLELPWLVEQVTALISEAETIGWQELIDRYISVDRMTHHQAFYWDGEHMRHAAGEGYIGFDLIAAYQDLARWMKPQEVAR